MDYGQRLLADRLAAAYTAGVLRGGARRRYEALLPSHPALREALRAWNDRLMPLTAAIAPVEPPPRVWERIAERIGFGAADATPGAPAAARAPRGLGFWRALAGLASVAAVTLAVLLASPRGRSEAPVLVVLTAMSGATDAPGMPSRPPSAIVASYLPSQDELVAMPVAPMEAMPDRSLHLWAIPSGGGAPRSLGLVTAEGGVIPMRAEALRGAAQLAVSLEPKGGSPGPGPTGPVVYAGAIKPMR